MERSAKRSEDSSILLITLHLSQIFLFFCRMNNCTASSCKHHLPSDLCRFLSPASTVSGMRQSANVQHGNMSKTTVKRVVVCVEVRGKKLFITDNYYKQSPRPLSSARACASSVLKPSHC